MNSLGLPKYISQYPLVLRFSMMLVFHFEIRSPFFLSRLFLRVVYSIHLYLGTRAVINPGIIVIEIAKQATKAQDKT